jgi:nuclear protein localization family protein 4
VTVVLSGDKDQQISSQAYQASSQAMALQRDDVLRPSDNPAMMAVKPSTDEEYVPGMK